MKATNNVRDREQTGSGIGTVVGILLIILGIIAIARPVFATIASTLVFGWLFILAGIVQLAYAFVSRGVGQFIWKILLGLLYLGAGIIILSNVFSGAIALTLILGITLFFQGVIQVILSFGMRPARSWSLVLVGGIIEIILGIFIWSEWPFNADWLIGLWVGIGLFFNGVWILVLSLTKPRSTQP